jgi:hypothetical protein
VHADDIAWHEAIIGWDHLLAAGILEPVHRGEPVRYRPPKWDERAREGAIEVPGSCGLIVVEGVGARRADLAPLYDAVVWVQADVVEARRRGLVRDGGDVEFWDHCDAEETRFFRRDRPWERADLIVAGTPKLPHDAATELVVAGA